MKKLIYLVSILILCYSSNAFNRWDKSVSIDTSFWDISLFANNEITLNDKYSINFHPLTVFVAPSIDLKYNILDKNLSLFGGINYPTPLLNLLSRKGAGGFISPEFDIPQLISFRFGYEQNYDFNEYLRLYSNLSIEFSPTKLEKRMMIDLPLIEPQLAVYNKYFGLNLISSIQGKIYKGFDYYLKIKADVFPFKTDEIDSKYQDYIPKEDLTLFIELNPLIIWNYSNTFQMVFGSKTTNGDYLFGRKWHTIPFIDFRKTIYF